jgi:hypothetical protein
MKYLVIDLEIAKKHNLKLYEAYVFAVFQNNPDTLFNIVTFKFKYRFIKDDVKVSNAITALYKKGLIEQPEDCFMRLKKI